MNASNLSTVERLAEELVARLTIEIEASGRHVHLSRVDVETLFPFYKFRILRHCYIYFLASPLLLYNNKSCLNKL